MMTRVFTVLVFALFSCATNVWAQSDLEKAQELINSATASAKNFTEDSNMVYLHENLAKAHGVMIIPKMSKMAFILGASGGDGVLLKHREDDSWSQPVFYTLHATSFGFQIGGETSETILMIMTEQAMEGFLASSFKLGADASVAAGPTGVGGKSQTAEVLTFSRTKGAFAGFSLEGSSAQLKPVFNQAYYGAEVDAEEVFKETVSNPHSDGLRAAVAELVKVGRGDN